MRKTNHVIRKVLAWTLLTAMFLQMYVPVYGAEGFGSLRVHTELYELGENFRLYCETAEGGERIIDLDPDLEYGIIPLVEREDALTVNGESGASGFSVKKVVLRQLNPQTNERKTFYLSRMEEAECYVALEDTDGRIVDSTRGIWFRDDGETEWSRLPADRYDVSAAGTVRIAVDRPSGTYAVFWKEETPSGDGKAFLFYTSDSNLKDAPRTDTEAMKETLHRLDQFSADTIRCFPVSVFDEDVRERLQEQMDELFGDNTDDSLSLVYYSGHGRNSSAGITYIVPGSDRISGPELRQMLTRYKGRFIVILDCCYSGGSLFSLRGEEQDDVPAIGSGFPSRFSVITACSSREVSWQSNLTGGQLTTSLGHALGYDRHDTLYRTYMADYDGNREITMRELKACIEDRGMISSPTWFPENSDDVLFSYTESGGEPAAFSVDQVTLEYEENDDDTISVHVTANVTNRLDCAADFDGFLGSKEDLFILHRTGNREDILRFLQNYTFDDLNDDMMNLRNGITHSMKGPVTIDPGETKTIEIEGTMPSYILELMELPVLRIWCENRQDGEKSNPFINRILEIDLPGEGDQTIDRDALKIRQPSQTSEPENAVEVSGSLPMLIQFDREPVEKNGKAACLLTVTVYPVDDAGEKIGEEAVTVADGIRPSYGIVESALQESMGSTHICVWDLKNDAGQTVEDGLYLVEVTCRYEDGGEEDSRTVSTYVRLCQEVEAKQIHEVIFDSDLYNYYGGINNATISQDGTIIPASFDAVASDMEYLFALLSSYNGSNNLNVEVSWMEQDAEGNWVAMEDAEQRSIAPGTYAARTTVSIPGEDRDRYRFTTDCALQMMGHQTIPGSVSVSENGGILTGDILHTIAEVTSSAIQLPEEIAWGDVIRIEMEEGWEIMRTMGLTALGDGRYRVSGTSPYIMAGKLSDEEERCACYTTYTIAVNSSLEGYLQVGSKRIYIVGIDQALDLEGYSITVDGIRIPVIEDMLEGWDDSYLSQSNKYEMAVTYEGRTYGTITIVTLYQNDGIHWIIPEESRFTDKDYHVLDIIDPGDDFSDLKLRLTQNHTVTDSRTGQIDLKWSTLYETDGDYSVVYGADSDTRFSFRIDYPEGTGPDDEFRIETTETLTGSVTLETGEDGIWITASPNGALVLGYRTEKKSSGSHSGATSDQEESTEEPTEDVLDRFSDLNKTAWYADAVRYVVSNGLMSGFADGTFGPDDDLSRAMLAQILYNREGKPPVDGTADFTDVRAEAWYGDAIRWASDRKIVSGFGNGTFGPDRAVTREQLAVMLWQYAGAPESGFDLERFGDAERISSYARAAMAWASETGILSGYSDGTLRPGDRATRAQAAQMLMNFFTNSSSYR